MEARTKSAKIPGEFARAELATTNTAAATAFYGALLGWRFVEETLNYGPAYYHVELAGGGAAGGLYQLESRALSRGVPPHWTPAVAVPHADEAVQAVRALGGGVLQDPFAAFDEGRLALVRDPTGAHLQLLEPSAAGRPLGDPAASGMFSWHELATPDLDGAAQFLAAAFGWRRVDEERGPLRYAVMMRGGEAVCGLNELPERWRGKVAAHWLSYFTVDDADASARFAGDRGARVLMPPVTAAGVGRFVVLADPQGAAFGLFSRLRTTA